MRIREALKEFLSTPVEIHAFTIGIYAGLTEWRGMDSELIRNPDVQQKFYCACGGYLIGTLIRWAIIVSIALIFYIVKV